MTVRALRLYERLGLIDPARSSKGWRLYGPAELQRLNVIATLKAFGMTLEQIRSLLQTNPPPLARMLEMQLRACRAKRDEADRALGYVRAALAAIQSGQSLALEELCNLTRNMEMGNRHAITRELINEEISPHEERAYLTWMSVRPPEERKAMQEYGAAVRALFLCLEELRAKKCEPSAPEAQSLIARWNALAVQYGLREHMTALIEWNPVVAQKWLRVGERALSLSVASAPDDALWAYFGAAQAASPWYQALKQTADEAAKLAQSRADPSSASAVALGSRLAAICSDHFLGNPLVYARWAVAMQFRGSAEENVRKKGAWAYLARALEEEAARATLGG